jgi:2-desacetyl-2-hydroxyethyl bacteriochlorophyllide A dehydrogenase
MVSTTKRRAVLFKAPREITLQEDDLPLPAPGQVLVKSLLSGISSGTEMLVYRGQFPSGLAVDATIPDLAAGFNYPLKYGYSLVGKIVEAAPDVELDWVGKLVFAFHPHESYFTTTTEELHPLPCGMSVDEAIFLPNTETAVNFLLDGRPMIGERAVVFGQGVVGLLTTALLAQFPLSCLITVDPFPVRRKLSLELGANLSLDPDHPQVGEALKDSFPDGADLVFELTGLPEVLNQAIDITRYSGRIVVGSWYGEKRAEIDLGGRFHRERIRLISSQVSSLDPGLSGRWDKARRLQVAWEALDSIKPFRFITHRFPVEEASQAYQLLDQGSERVLQVVLEYFD